MVNDFQPLTILAKSSIIDAWLGFKYVSDTFVKSIVIQVVLHIFLSSTLFDSTYVLIFYPLSFILYSFVSPTKMFFTINLHFIPSNKIYTYRKLNLSLTNSIYLVFLPLEMQRKLTQTKVYHTFFHFV